MEQNNFSGNERQLKLLLKAIRENDITIWNNFVKSSGKFFVANLAGVNLSFHNLKEINLSGANLKDANLEGANLTRANLHRTKLFSANLSDTNLTKANITNSFLKDAILTKSNAEGANFRESDLAYANLDGANLENANILKTNFKFASLKGTNMVGVKKSKTTKIIAKPKSRVLTKEDSKKLSPWKLARQEETLRRVERVNKEKAKRNQELEENMRGKEKLNRNIFTNEKEPEIDNI